MIVAKITEEVANAIRGYVYTEGKYFNPILDADGNYIVSLQEAQYLLEDYEEIEYKPLIIEEEIE
tara:strand:+ start:4049 stop:4243 length:195 start_codon:yes stop_codon:yes gene_type:complete